MTNSLRDQASRIAKNDSAKALKIAKKIVDPWYRVQALASVIRYTDGDPVSVAKSATTAAAKCDDEYKRTAVRAWIIAALAERDFHKEARAYLKSCLSQIEKVEPLGSRAEALTLLLKAAAQIDESCIKDVFNVLQSTGKNGTHWRLKRAIKHGEGVLKGEVKPGPFFWR